MPLSTLDSDSASAGSSTPILWLAVTAALLFIPASTVHWPSAWIMLGEMGAVALTWGTGC